eukprot:2503518-Rhodomonas_salina.1
MASAGVQVGPSELGLTSSVGAGQTPPHCTPPSYLSPPRASPQHAPTPPASSVMYSVQDSPGQAPGLRGLTNTPEEVRG